VTRALVVSAYAILGTILAWSHLARLGGGYCCDEIATVVEYVRPGPHAIFAGAYVPNNHELFSLLGWATSEAFGESEIALRLWAAIPFLAGVAVATTWLHVRLGALSGILFLFFATASPLLLDITRQARGYGLAFFAMAVLVVAAFEAVRSGHTWVVIAFCAAGLVGTWTLPHFVIAFVTTAAVLIMQRPLRVRCAVGLGISLVAVVTWYAPHFDDIAVSSLQSYGVQIQTAWVVTAPLDQTLVPALTLIDDSFVRPDLSSLVLVAAFAVLISSSPLLRRGTSAFILVSGVVATVLAFWMTQTNVVPRFFSFLLVPLFMLAATGAASILARLSTRPPVLRTIVAGATLAAVALAAAPFLAEIPRLPREANKEAAQTIREIAPPSTPVFVYAPYPLDLAFHLGRPVTRLRTPADVARVCRASRDVVLVVQPYLLPPANVTCTRRPGTRHRRFHQYARGERIDVWIVPAETSGS
jgi:hypothetical protein